jgi:hypothetical protein
MCGKHTKSQDDAGRSLAADRRKRAKRVVGAAKVIEAISSEIVIVGERRQRNYAAASSCATSAILTIWSATK